MELFILFLMACFVGGVLLRNSSKWVRQGLLLATALFLSLIYFVLERMI
jgi:hypothetical protein